MLSIDKALELHALLKPHLPETDKESEFLDFIGDVIESMRENDPASYVYCMRLVSGLELDDFEGMIVLEAFAVFLEGLMENNVSALVRFCGTLGL